MGVNVAFEVTYLEEDSELAGELSDDEFEDDAGSEAVEVGTDESKEWIVVETPCR